MRFEVAGNTVYASTGGRDFDGAGDVLLFIHGSGQNHLGYQLQTRFFANRGWQVLAPDMPAHGLSDGTPLTSIEEMADWHSAFLEAAGVKSAMVIGHSQGGLIAMELARRHPELVKGISLVACALAIPVNDALLGMAQNKQHAAIAAMTDWGHGPSGHSHDHTVPGQNHLNYGRQLMASNKNGALYADLRACVDYSDGAAAAQSLKCNTQVILAQKDKMTPVKFGLKMAQAVGDASPTIIQNAGHMIPSESSVELNKALRAFFEDNK